MTELEREDIAINNSRLERERVALTRAMKWCEIYGLPIDSSIKPIYERLPRRHWLPFRRKTKKEYLVGYYVIDETGSTTVATVHV